MTSRDISLFSSLKPFSIGFESIFDQFEDILGNGGLSNQSNFPPYNIRSGKDQYTIELACAGYDRENIELEQEDNLLTVRTKKVDKTVEKDANGEILHKGISSRAFVKQFTISDDVKLVDASLKNGLLKINLKKVALEQKKKKLIPIK